MKVKITLDNQVHYATLADNPSVRSLFQQLPITLPLEDYAASEKIARPQFKLNTAEAPPAIAANPATSLITHRGAIWPCFTKAALMRTG